MRITKDKASNLYLGITVISTNILLLHYFYKFSQKAFYRILLTRWKIFQLLPNIQSYIFTTWQVTMWHVTCVAFYERKDWCFPLSMEKGQHDCIKNTGGALWRSILVSLNEACYINHSKVDWIYWTKLKDLVTT